jgi:hypothetical protein
MDWSTLWNWLSDTANQNTLAWLGGGVVIVLSGIWAVVKFFKKSNKPQITVAEVRADRGGIAAGRDVNVTKK